MGYKTRTKGLPKGLSEKSGNCSQELRKTWKNVQKTCKRCAKSVQKKD